MLERFLSTWEPSRVGIGSKLNKNSIVLTVIIWSIKLSRFSDRKTNRAKVANRRTVSNAKEKFDNGPARIIRRSFLFLVLGVGREIRTGFPHPKIAKPELKKMMMKPESKVLMRSMSALGSRVMCPSFLGSGSPIL